MVSSSGWSRVTKIRAPIGSSANDYVTATTDYNGADAVTKATDPRGYSTTFLYDVDRQLTKVTDARGKTWQYGYDLAHQVTKIIDPRPATTPTPTTAPARSPPRQTRSRSGCSTTTKPMRTPRPPTCSSPAPCTTRATTARCVRVNMLYHRLNKGVHLVEVRVFPSEGAADMPAQ